MSKNKLIDRSIVPTGWSFDPFEKRVFKSAEKYNCSNNKTDLECFELEHIEEATGRTIGSVSSLKQKSIKNRFRRGQVIFGKLRPYLRKYFLAEVDGLASSETWVLSFKESEGHNNFLYYLIQSDNFIEKCNRTTGTKMPRAEWNLICKELFLFPSSIEQRRIAQILSTWDKSIGTLAQLIAAKQQLKKGLMQQLLTGKKRLPGFKGKWEKKSLLSYCIDSKRAIVDGPFGSNLKTIHFRNKGVPVINSSCVTDLVFKSNNYVYIDEELFKKEVRSKVEGGDIVMAKIGARCGASAIMPNNHPVSILSGNSLKISIDTKKNSTLFIWHQLVNEYNVNQFKNCKSTGAQPSISIPDLRQLLVSSPSKQEQVAIASVLSALNKELEFLEQNINLLKQQKKGLMQQLLTGKKRVKV